MRLRLACSLFAGCVALAGCAGGPKLATVQSDLPKLPENAGRIYFYRTAIMGLAVQPGIYLNGQKVGSCEPNGVFIADAQPGNYEATVSTEVERKLTFTLDNAEEKFVRCYISIGLLVGHGNLELVDPAEARGEIQGLSYTGRQELH